MKRSDIVVMPEFFDRYINLVEDIAIVDALEKYSPFENMIDANTLKKLDGKRYAPDKWTIKDILQHIIDNERVQSYRAMRFARRDVTSLPGYDEQLFGSTADAERRDIDELLSEFAIVRQGTIALYKSFTPEMLKHEGVAFKKISVLALGFVLVGHPIHHVNIIRERYLPLIG